MEFFYKKPSYENITLDELIKDSKNNQMEEDKIKFEEDSKSLILDSILDSKVISETETDPEEDKKYNEEEIEYDDDDSCSIDEVISEDSKDSVDSLKKELEILKLKKEIFKVKNDIFKNEMQIICQFNELLEMGVDPILFKNSMFYKKNMESFKKIDEQQRENLHYNYTLSRVLLTGGTILTGYVGLILFFFK